MCDHNNLALALLADGHRVAQVANAVINLDLVVQELLKSIGIEDLIGSRLRGIDHKLIVGESLANSRLSSRAELTYLVRDLHLLLGSSGFLDITELFSAY